MELRPSCLTVILPCPLGHSMEPPQSIPVPQGSVLSARPLSCAWKLEIGTLCQAAAQVRHFNHDFNRCNRKLKSHQVKTKHIPTLTIFFLSYFEAACETIQISNCLVVLFLMCYLCFVLPLYCKCMKSPLI